MTHLKFAPAVFGRTFNNLVENLMDELPIYNNEWAERKRNWVPVNIQETKDSFEIAIQAPGFSKEDFKISIEDKFLTISGGTKKEEVKESEDKKTVRREFKQYSFKRSFNLGDTVNTENVNANYENGILQVTLAKKEEKKAVLKEISVS